MNVEQARIAEEAGAVAVMALERIPADIRVQGGVARMSDPALINEIKEAVTIPVCINSLLLFFQKRNFYNHSPLQVMAKARIGHFVEAQILQALEIDYIDESEVLTMADEVVVLGDGSCVLGWQHTTRVMTFQVHHINKQKFSAPFVCGCRNLGEALRRVTEGAAMLRTKGEAGTGNIVEAV